MAPATSNTTAFADRRFTSGWQPALLGLGFVVLLAIGAATVFLSLQSGQDSGVVAHTLDVQKKLSNLLLDVRRAETGQRGYLLTGRRAYLDDYVVSVPALDPLIADLRRLTADNPERTKQLDEAERLTKAKIAELAKTIEIYDAGRRDESLALVLTNQGRDLMTSLRNLVETMLTDEGELLTRRISASRATGGRLLDVAFVGTVLVLLIGIAAVLLVQRSNRQRDESRRAVEATNANLENTIALRTADLTEANEEIQRYAYIVSHDLRSPLVNIMGFTAELESVRKDLFDQLTAPRDEAGTTPEKTEALGKDFDEAISFIKTSITKMDRLINAILKLSREGRREFHAEALDMKQMFEMIAASVAHQVSETQTTITVEKLPPVVSDRLALEQIFSNLVDNALKYLQPGVPGRIRVSGRQTLGRIEYDVEDNGRGIDANDHQRIFELFRRSGPQDRPGEGIGLAHVRALVRRLGGTMSVRSELNRGSVFTVSLPRRWLTEERTAA